MCVIIHAAPKQTIEKKILQACYTRNADGWGIMWADGGKVHTAKDVSDFDTFYNIWINDVPRHAERGIHFRIKTHGGKNQQNCHPFKPNPNVGLMHNGIMNNVPLIEGEMSDTYNFCKYELAPIIAGWDNFMEDKDFTKLLEMNDVTSYGKLLLIDAQGKSLRINDSMWHKHEGVYFSNSFSIPYKATVYDSRSKTYNYPSRAANHVSSAGGSKAVSSGALNSAYNPYACDDPDFDADGWPVNPEKGTVLDTAGFRNIRGTITPNTTLLGAPYSKPATEIVSDLYASNKTAEEGEAYLASLEAEAAEEKRREQEELREALTGGAEEVVDPFPVEVVSGEQSEDEEDDEQIYEVTYDYVTAMTFEELWEDVEAFPKTYAHLVRALINTCASAGIFKIGSGETDIILNAKKAG